MNQLRRLSWLFVLLFLLIISAQSPGTAAPETKGKVQLETTAQSAVLMDGSGTILYEKDPHKRLPPASVTKVMTLLLAVEAVESGRIQLTDDVFTSENAIVFSFFVGQNFFVR